MKLLKGKKIAEKILKKIEGEIKKSSLQPALAVILVGNNPASNLYVKLKQKAAKKIGIRFHLLRFSEKAKEAEIIQKIKKLNADKKVSGLIVQLPLPKNLSTQNIINAIDPQKDVDGFHPENRRLFLKKQMRFFPVFSQAIIEILIASRVKLKKKKAIVIANSKIFGEIMVAALKNKDMEADYFLSKDLKNNLISTRKAEIIISAVGKSGLITDKIIRPGAIVVDGGITKKGKRVLGDADRESVKNKVAFLTPVPGGVGPVTIACLLRNTFEAARKSA